MVVFNKNDINTIEEAKKYEGYNGKKLNGIRGGKTAKIFESPKLNDNDGNLDKTKLQDLAEFLHIYKTAKAKSGDLNSPAADWAPLLGKLWREKRNNSDFYQLVNNRGSGGKVDLIIEKLEDCLFKNLGDISPSQQVEWQEKQKRLADIKKQGEAKDKEVEGAAEKCSPDKISKATDYLVKVEKAVDALKADLQDNNSAGRKILDYIISYTKETCDGIFTTTSPSSSRALIRTGYNDNNTNITQSLFLTRDLPQQYIALFKKFDKEHLFSAINATNWSHQKKKEIKDTFEQMLTWTFQRSWNFRIENNIAAKERCLKKKFQQEQFDEEEVKRKEKDYIFVSDVLKFMDALFPKGSDYKNSPFIQASGPSCLKLVGSDNLDTKFPVYWRGRDDTVIGERFGGSSLFDANFTSEKKELSWANGELANFFWKVYNDDACVRFNSYDEVLSKDGTTMRRIRSEPITDYEAQILTHQKRHRLVDAAAQSYLERAKEIIEANGVNFKECAHEWKPVIRKISMAADKTWGPLMRVAKGFATYQDMVNASKKIGWDKCYSQIIEYDKTTITDDVINKYDEMKLIAQAQIDVFIPLQAEWGKKLSERKQITIEENKVLQEIENFENVIKATLDNNLVEVRKQFQLVYNQPSIGGGFRYRYVDMIFMKGLLNWIEKKEQEPEFSADPSFDTQAYKTDLEKLEKSILGCLANYHIWERLGGNSFIERIDSWKKTMPGGGTYDEETLRAHLTVIKNELKTLNHRELTLTEKGELEQIERYLSKPIEKQITNSQLRQALGVDVIPASLVYKWRNVEGSEVFSTDANKIKELADKINGLSDKTNFLKFLQDNLAIDTNLPIFPASGNEKQKLSWFFTLNPSKVIRTIYAFSLTDNTEKEKIKAEMNSLRDANNIPLSRKTRAEGGYGDGTNFTDEGMVEYLTEKVLGKNHKFASIQGPSPEIENPFWRPNNPWAWGSGIVIGIIVLAIGYAILRWEKVVEWWNKPADAEGNGGEEDE